METTQVQKAALAGKITVQAAMKIAKFKKAEKQNAILDKILVKAEGKPHKTASAAESEAPKGTSRRRSAPRGWWAKVW